MSKVVSQLFSTPFSPHKQRIIDKKEAQKPTLTQKVVGGHKVDETPAMIALSTEEGANKLAKIYEKEGYIPSDLNHFKNIIGTDDLRELKKAVKFDKLAQKDDEISRIAYKQFKILFDYLEKIIDEKRLEQETGITSDLKAEKDYFITKRLLDDPTEANKKGKGVTIWTQDEAEFLADLKKRKNFKFIKEGLLDGDMDYDFLNPYESLSDTAKGVLQSRRHQLNQYFDTLPHKQRQKAHKTFHDYKLLNRDPLHFVQNNTSQAIGSLPKNFKIQDHSFLNHFKQDPHDEVRNFRQKAARHLKENNAEETFEKYYASQDIVLK